MTWIKICGITRMEDAHKAASLGVDAIGFVFAPSPRRVKPEVAKKIIGSLRKPPLAVGVFVNEHHSAVADIAEYCGLDVLQFHGEEPVEYCRMFDVPIIKALRVKDESSLLSIPAYPGIPILLDTYDPTAAGGTGKTFPVEIALKAGRRDFILSGGLNPFNVRRAVELVMPGGVDVSSGVEEFPGKKDHTKMEWFVKEVREFDEKTEQKRLFWDFRRKIRP